jgi:hypothetical protein
MPLVLRVRRIEESINRWEVVVKCCCGKLNTYTFSSELCVVVTQDRKGLDDVASDSFLLSLLLLLYEHCAKYSV